MQEYEKNDNIFQRWMKKQPVSSRPPPDDHARPVDDMTFYAQHLGTQLHTREPDLQKVTTIVRRMINHAKSTNRKLPRYTISVSSKYITMERTGAQERPSVLPLYLVQYCASDVVSPKVFVFIASVQQAYQVNVYYCQKRAKAEALTIAFAKCFKRAYRDWESRVREQTDRHGHLRVRSPDYSRQLSLTSSGSSTPPSPKSPTNRSEDEEPPKKHKIQVFDMYGMNQVFTKRATINKKPEFLRIGNDYDTLARNNDVKRYLKYGDYDASHDDPDEEWSQYSY
ncbi:low density lipoprotein receptor adapter protein 1-B-like [Ptychodera flava]|uniref:low density lipoprotein receptor adapter protein 1-B-like n=1 Tax=Ptychodera flava TaxID=63121 RepID=UPI00396A249E